jgi:hypothetical protein
MNSIQLTAEHKSKLLEMCRELFPEYINFRFYYNDLCFLTQETFDIAKEFETSGVNRDYNYTVDDLYTEEYDYQIHWFEFCITKLWLKIALNTNHDPSGIRSIILEEIHPIDYLYSQFKTIKQ